MAVFKRNVWVHPFHEEDPKGLVDLVGADHVLLRLGLPAPGRACTTRSTYVDELAGLPHADKAKVMGGNLAGIMKVAA